MEASGANVHQAARPSVYPSTTPFDPEHPSIKHDILLMIVQYLRDQGFVTSSMTLQDEASVRLRTGDERAAIARRLRECVLDGAWDKVHQMLDMRKSSSSTANGGGGGSSGAGAGLGGGSASAQGAAAMAAAATSSSEPKEVKKGVVGGANGGGGGSSGSGGGVGVGGNGSTSANGNNSGSGSGSSSSSSR